ncbi:MAG: phosphotransferase [Alphaproteobacteria bacterium]
MPPADRLVAALPAIGGALDAAYLSAALARAGRPAPDGSLAVERIDGGRISSNVLSLKTAAGAFVLKKFAPEPWRLALFGSSFNEPALWAAGLTRALPAPLSCPTIDVAFHVERSECWMLMDDVSAGVAPRGSFDPVSFGALLEGLATLHARFWDRDDLLAGLPLVSLEQHTAMFATPSAAAGGAIEAQGWVAEVLEKVFLFRTYVPVLLEALGPRDADFYLALCADPARWLEPLGRMPPTLVHGDIRRANVAFLQPGAVSLFDWDFACRAPAATDLAWYWFLHFWCYPPADGIAPEQREPVRQHYVRCLAAALGGRFDPQAFERAWDLSWLKVFAQIGFCLADPLVGTPSAEAAARARATIGRAVERAKRIANAAAD